MSDDAHETEPQVEDPAFNGWDYLPPCARSYLRPGERSFVDAADGGLVSLEDVHLLGLLNEMVSLRIALGNKARSDFAGEPPAANPIRRVWKRLARRLNS